MFDYFIRTSLIVHVFAGTCALITGLLAMLLKNQTPRHKKAGKWYLWFMTIVFVTGFYLSLIQHNLFLFYISIFSYYMVIVAYRVLKYKHPKPIARIDWIIEIIGGIAFLGLILFSIGSLILHEQRYSAIIPFVFGSIGLSFVWKNLKRFRTGPKEKLAWKKVHIGNMIGSYIAAVTAFLVNQSEYFPVDPVFLWLGPTVVLVPLIVLETRKVRKIPIGE